MIFKSQIVKHIHLTAQKFIILIIFILFFNLKYYYIIIISCQMFVVYIC